jgi:hypothetical protein
MLQQYFQMFHLCQMYDASKCFMLQVFHGARWEMGTRPRHLGWGVVELGVDEGATS